MQAIRLSTDTEPLGLPPEVEVCNQVVLGKNEEQQVAAELGTASCKPLQMIEQNSEVCPAPTGTLPKPEQPEEPINHAQLEKHQALGITGPAEQIQHELGTLEKARGTPENGTIPPEVVQGEAPAEVAVPVAPARPATPAVQAIQPEAEPTPGAAIVEDQHQMPVEKISIIAAVEEPVAKIEENPPQLAAAVESVPVPSPAPVEQQCPAEGPAVVADIPQDPIISTEEKPAQLAIDTLPIGNQTSASEQQPAAAPAATRGLVTTVVQAQPQPQVKVEAQPGLEMNRTFSPTQGLLDVFADLDKQRPTRNDADRMQPINIDTAAAVHNLEMPTMQKTQNQQQVQKTTPGTKSATDRQRPVRAARMQITSYAALEVGDELDVDQPVPNSKGLGQKNIPHQQHPSAKSNRNQPQPARMASLNALQRQKLVMQDSYEDNVQPRMPVVSVCLIDKPWPKRRRSITKQHPRTSRASINRLKQAAYGTLPLGVQSLATKALLAADAREPAGDPSASEQYSYDSDDSGLEDRRQRKRGRSSASVRQQFPHNNQNEVQHDMLPQGFGDGGDVSGDQRRLLMQRIASAPPHLRQAMLHRLMEQHMAPQPQAPSGLPPQLGSLMRDQQQVIVQQLMSRMTPQQRHALLQLPTHEQAAVLQQFYQQHILPQQRQQQQQAALAQQQQQQQQMEQQDHQRRIVALLTQLPPHIRERLAILPEHQQQQLISQLLQRQNQGPPPGPPEPQQAPMQFGGIDPFTAGPPGSLMMSGGAMPGLGGRGMGFGPSLQQQQQQHALLRHQQQQQQQQQQQRVPGPLPGMNGMGQQMGAIEALNMQSMHGLAMPGGSSLMQAQPGQGPGPSPFAAAGAGALPPDPPGGMGLPNDMMLSIQDRGNSAFLGGLGGDSDALQEAVDFLLDFT